ncbi:LamG-like jellyroll fold domain-containing protein [Nonomuraea cavernae]|uniref:LamG-like jellyroll fold domain-containing protein n=1 Tax=Nonomuraea cavernae TaxID=2045107 RepID=A0A917Z4D3_9ACTN|nr:LamG domain-containing protein [Nonomuraea cavernae]MCA2187071.1 LamG domain-containing protein [Nonomuraea cavernae]GGO74843.1 hypothetical protein GCM10012289_48470 [Nonomuraea cavernae]
MRIYGTKLEAEDIRADMATSVNGLTVPDTAPTMPGELTATGGYAAPGTVDGDIRLTWNASVDDKPGVVYRIYRATFLTFVPRAAYIIATVTTSGYTDSLRSLAPYYYYVDAVDSTGQASPMSRQAMGAVRPPRPVPAAAYGMEEGSGNVVHDSSGNLNSGQARNTAWTAGKHGNALFFNGTSSSVDVPPSYSLQAVRAVTFEAWVNPASYGRPDNKEVVISSAGNTLWSSMTAVWDNVPEASVRSGQLGSVRGPRLPLNTWSHLAFTFGEDGHRLYINGVLVHHNGLHAGEYLSGSYSPLRIGALDISSPRDHFHGLIDDVRVYTTALLPDQIAEDMSQPVI